MCCYTLLVRFLHFRVFLSVPLKRNEAISRFSSCANMFVFVCFDIHSNKRQVFALTKCLFYVLLLFFPATCLCFYFFSLLYLCVCFCTIWFYCKRIGITVVRNLYSCARTRVSVCACVVIKRSLLIVFFCFHISIWFLQLLFGQSRGPRRRGCAQAPRREAARLGFAACDYFLL